jgi:anthranilate phosphoribosyltransferase
VPTFLKCLGPLANPAGATRQLLGVGRPALLDLLAEALARLGAAHALVVHGSGGLDEVSLSGLTQVREVRDGRIRAWEWLPRDFGLAGVDMEAVRVANPEESAALILQVLRGEEGPALRLVLANAAALLVANKANDLHDGVTQARQAIASGKALDVLTRLQKVAR